MDIRSTTTMMCQTGGGRSRGQSTDLLMRTKRGCGEGVAPAPRQRMKLQGTADNLPKKMLVGNGFMQKTSTAIAGGDWQTVGEPQCTDNMSLGQHRHRSEIIVDCCSLDL